ncbi:MAG: nucleotidyltransferase domain-containing protein [Nanoarchaeota archaeon]
MGEKKRDEDGNRKKLKVMKKLPLEKSKLINEKDIAMDFAEKVHKKFDRMIKASVLFGSQATNSSRPGSDIDVILIIDDASINWDNELIAWYREELGKLIAVQRYAKDLHINTIKLTTWWQDLVQGDPVVINILRYGEALIDSGGFFNPLKSLLLQGRMRSTPEAVYMALQRAPAHLARSRIAILGSIEGVYWTMMDAAQAALITASKLPPSPENIPQMMKTTFVDNNLMKIEFVRELREIYVLHKGIMHGDIHEIKGDEIDKWQKRAEVFLLEMTKIIDRILDAKNADKK